MQIEVERERERQLLVSVHCCCCCACFSNLIKLACYTTQGGKHTLNELLVYYLCGHQTTSCCLFARQLHSIDYFRKLLAIKCSCAVKSWAAAYLSLNKLSQTSLTNFQRLFSSIGFMHAYLLTHKLCEYIERDRCFQPDTCQHLAGKLPRCRNSRLDSFCRTLLHD